MFWLGVLCGVCAASFAIAVIAVMSWINGARKLCEQESRHKRDQTRMATTIANAYKAAAARKTAKAGMN